MAGAKAVEGVCRSPTPPSLHGYRKPNRLVELLVRHKASCHAAKNDAASSDKKRATSLSDIIAFESEPQAQAWSALEDRPRGEELVDRASAALAAARQALEGCQERTPARPTSLTFSYASDRPDTRRLSPNLQQSPSQGKSAQEATRAALGEALSSSNRASGGAPRLQDGDGAGAGDAVGAGAPPRWAEGISQAAGSSGEFGWGQVPQPARAEGSPQRETLFAEPSDGLFDFISQDALDVVAARAAALPPLESVAELTSAFQPPQRGGLPDEAAPSSAGRALADGDGVLTDGTRYTRQSGEERGANGYWHRWTRLAGVSAQGKVEWEETWWEASDWAGYREMGAEKAGCRADGAAWRETWREAIAHDAASGEPIVERSAHKWAHAPGGDEWEERWGEHYWSGGRANKFADKWGKDGPNVWHERWGEDYDGAGGCTKWTDKWAERLLEQGGNEQWGDKWEEKFKDGKGTKSGETWSMGAGGERYQRWWGEAHHGDGWVQKYGNSSTGERWDVSERMDTYYNPIPHFDYALALAHSPQLRTVATLPRSGEGLGGGIADL